MTKYFLLILLILAIGTAVYLTTHYKLLEKFVAGLKFPVPSILRPGFAPTSPGSRGTVADFPTASTTREATRRAVRVSSVMPASGFGDSVEIALSADLSSGEMVNITGWTIKSNKGFFKIPKAQEAYSFDRIETDIWLKNGERVRIFSGVSTKGNFRLNKCTGYLENTSPSTPSLPRNCPAVNRDEISGFSGACQDYISSLNSCENPLLNPPVPLDDNACHEFLRQLNYVGCVERYGKDSDFLSSEWRVWVGNEMRVMDSRHDKIQLLDARKSLIDEYVY